MDKLKQNEDRIAQMAYTSQSAWYREIQKRPQMLSTRDIREVFGVGRSKAWSIMHELGAMKIGDRLRPDRNVLVAYIAAHHDLL